MSAFDPGPVADRGPAGATSNIAGPRGPECSPFTDFTYAPHFGFTEPPFSLAPDPRYLYMSERHGEALAHLLYGIGDGGGFVQLTGEVGTGKTTLCRCLVEQLPPQVDVGLILNPKLTALELLASVCDELGIPYPAGTTSTKVLVDILHRYLLEAHARGRRPVLIIDEAQNLAGGVLEQIRLLTNLETTRAKLLQIILIGQPELLQMLARPKLRQVAQRITARYHLLPFSDEETRAYVRHRMKVAGRTEPVFSDAALRRVHRFSGGVPRLINVVCDRALLGAYGEGRTRVDAAMVSTAAREILGGVGWRWSIRASVGIAGAGAALLVSAMLGIPAVRSASEPLIQTVARSAATVKSAWVRWSPIPPGAANPAPSTSNQPMRPSGAVLEMATPRPLPAGPDSRRGERGRSGVRAAGQLTTMLSDPLVRSDKPAAFANLYSLWGLDYDSTRGGLACDPGRLKGLRCLFKKGNWNALRGFDLPALLELTGPSGKLQYAAVLALTPHSALLAFGPQRLSIPLTEIDAFWDGFFIVLWRPPRAGTIALTPGMRGSDVEWLRLHLAELDGLPIGHGTRDVYDDELRGLVAAFQRSRGLTADGIAGEETLAHLTLAVSGAGTPSLSSRHP